jgi:hypothetical protein
MLKEQFELAAAETRIRTPELVDAACATLVYKENVSVVAARFGISDHTKIHRAAASIEKKWEEICMRNGWKFVAIALPENVMDSMLLLQSKEIEGYRKARDKQNRKK